MTQLSDEVGRIELRRGGWFVIYETKDWSGPWRTDQAAELALVGKYEEAQKLERSQG
jgi:hypothetical protein